MENKIIHLKDRSVISIQGEDSEEFLKSIVTCNLDLQDQNSLSGALLSPQGKLMNNFIVFKKDHKFLIDIHKSSTEEFLKKLSIYKLKSKVLIEEENELSVFVSLEKPYKDFQPDPRNKELGWRGVGQIKNISSEKMKKYEKKRLSLGIVEEGKDIKSGEYFPIEMNLDYCNSIDFYKGCFVGQEVTSRMQRRGKTKKRVFPFRTENILTNKDDIIFIEKKVGTVIKTIDDIGIALIRIEVIEDLISQSEKIIIGNDSCKVEFCYPQGYS